MLSKWLDDDPATHDLAAKVVELADLFTHQAFDFLGRMHVTEGYLQRQFHGYTSIRVDAN
jgi:hypothetical protein